MSNTETMSFFLLTALLCMTSYTIRWSNTCIHDYAFTVFNIPRLTTAIWKDEESASSASDGDDESRQPPRALWDSIEKCRAKLLNWLAVFEIGSLCCQNGFVVFVVYDIT